MDLAGYSPNAQRLEEFCGLVVSDTTVREVAQEHGAQANEWQRTEPVAVPEFREATGEVEFTTDGTCTTPRAWPTAQSSVAAQLKGPAKTSSAAASKPAPPSGEFEESTA